MNPAQQELPLPQWGGKRKGAGRKRKASRPLVPHRPRGKFRNAAVHVTLRLCPDVWNLRSRRCFQVLQHAFQAGCENLGVRIIHFSVQGNHIHLIVEAPDAASLAQAVKGLKIRMPLGLNKLMDRRGPVFSDRYHLHVLKTPREAALAARYVLDNWKVHARREGWPMPEGIDPYCSAAPRDHGRPLVAEPVWWLLCVGAERFRTGERAA